MSDGGTVEENHVPLHLESKYTHSSRGQGYWVPEGTGITRLESGNYNTVLVSYSMAI